jgi:hypothetical protein
MTQISWLVAFVLSLAAIVATIGIGAFLLRNAVKDALDLAAALPTRSIKDDTNETRESNRHRALQETLLLLAVRSVPGGILAIFGAVLLAWIFCKFLPKLPV